MLLGMADGWVTLAYCANLAVTAVCVVYGIARFNADDEGEGKRKDQ